MCSYVDLNDTLWQWEHRAYISSRFPYVGAAKVLSPCLNFCAISHVCRSAGRKGSGVGGCVLAKTYWDTGMLKISWNNTTIIYICRRKGYKLSCIYEFCRVVKGRRNFVYSCTEIRTLQCFVRNDFAGKNVVGGCISRKCFPKLTILGWSALETNRKNQDKA